MIGTTTIGVLALQGGFSEHLDILSNLRLGGGAKVTAIPVRTPDELAHCDALILPGGESTTIALLARISGLFDLLRQFSKEKPIWGTCAGAILLSKEVSGSKRGGQELLGQLDVKLGRNGWGSQVESFEADLFIRGMKNPHRPFTGVFIRAPVLLGILPLSDSSPPVEIIARLPDTIAPSSEASPFEAVPETIENGLIPGETLDRFSEHDLRNVVALRQGRHLLTTFHPELTQDDRFHEYFVRTCVLGDGSKVC